MTYLIIAWLYICGGFGMYLMVPPTTKTVGRGVELTVDITFVILWPILTTVAVFNLLYEIALTYYQTQTRKRNQTR